MQTESLNCNNCGAPIEVPGGANFVTCVHCNTQLAIKRTESVAYTETLQRIDRHTEQLADQVAVLTYQNELARLDREWDREKETYMSTDEHGRRHLPSEAGSLIGGGVAVVFGVGWMAFTSNMPGPGSGIALFGLVIIAAGIAMAVLGSLKAQKYRTAHRRYRHRRASLNVDQFRVGDTTATDQDGDIRIVS